MEGGAESMNISAGPKEAFINDCSIVIPTFNRADLLCAALEALCKQSTSVDRLQIVVCDSNSSDGTDGVIKTCREKFQDVSIVHLNTVNNVSAKRNLGIATATSDNIIFLDDDCIPEANFIGSHINALRANASTLGILCGVVTFPPDLVRSSNYVRYRESRHRAYDYAYSEGGTLQYKTIVTGNMSTRKSDLKSKGLFFDEEFFGYGMEDNEFGYRAEQAGFRITPCEAKIIHYDKRPLGNYVQKIFHASRDGIARLLEKSPNALWGMEFSRMLEPKYPHTSFLAKAAAKIYRCLLSRRIAYLLMKLLISTDKIAILYSPSLYRYVLAVAYLSGANSRDKRFRTNQETMKSWYL